MASYAAAITARHCDRITLGLHRVRAGDGGLAGQMKSREMNGTSAGNDDTEESTAAKAPLWAGRSRDMKGYSYASTGDGGYYLEYGACGVAQELRKLGTSAWDIEHPKRVPCGIGTRRHGTYRLADGGHGEGALVLADAADERQQCLQQAEVLRLWRWCGVESV